MTPIVISQIRKQCSRDSCSICLLAMMNREDLHLLNLVSDWMHDTACCFGYPSDSFRMARKRAGSAGSGGTPPRLTTPDAQPVAQLGRRPAMSPPPLPQAPRAAGRGATRLGQLGPGGQDNPTATSPDPVRQGRCSLCHLPWAAAGGAHQLLVIGVSWAARDCDGSPARSLPPAPQGEAVAGGARTGAATDGSPLALCAGLRVCGTGPVTAVSAGRERCTLLIASSARLRRPGVHWVGRSPDTTPPSRTRPTGRSSWAAAWRAGVAGPRARVSWAVVPWRAYGVVGGTRKYRQVATARIGGGQDRGPGTRTPGPRAGRPGMACAGRSGSSRRGCCGATGSRRSRCRVYCHAAPALWSRSVLLALDWSFPSLQHCDLS
jgi:hypothetical protein